MQKQWDEREPCVSDIPACRWRVLKRRLGTSSVGNTALSQDPNICNIYAVDSAVKSQHLANCPGVKFEFLP